MKKIICIVIALLSIFISVFFGHGCSYAPGKISIDSRSALMQPKFCYHFRPITGRLDIERIVVSKPQPSSEAKGRWELDSLWWIDSQRVWELEYKASDFLLFYYANCIFGWRPKPPVSCLTYGEVPPGYEEKVKALPLEPEQLYIVKIEEYGSPRDSEDLKFIIRADETGIPERLEYRSPDYIFDYTVIYLRLYNKVFSWK